MPKRSALNYNQFIIEANRLGRRMKLLEQATAQMPEKPYIDECIEGFAALAETLWAIGTVLRIIGDTPNGYINPEAMDELESHVEFAARLDQEEWVQDLLKADTLFGFSSELRMNTENAANAS